MTTSIEWTEETWNPTRGCSRVSEGCRNCYAERLAVRFTGPKGGYRGLVEYREGGPRWTGRVEFVTAKLGEPLRWRRPRLVFVDSMSDLFHDQLTNEDIAAVFGVMAAASRHTFQVLTKRAERMRRWFEWVSSQRGQVHVPLSVCSQAASQRLDSKAWDFAIRATWPLPNVWLGVSVEDQATADERIPELPLAAVRFVSYEPALASADFRRWLGFRCSDCGASGRDVEWARADSTYRDGHVIAGTTPDVCGPMVRALPIKRFEAFTPEAKRAYPVPPTALVERGIDWLIIGGESGPGARPFDILWAHAAIAQCRAAGVPCFVKQLGARPFVTPAEARRMGIPARSDDDGQIHFSDPKGGDMNEWPPDLRVREFPRAPTPGGP